tara:strand:- start:3637 stop:4161 length:525 start_codon:yes stop_codon:yes gene_type:complete
MSLNSDYCELGEETIHFNDVSNKTLTEKMLLCYNYSKSVQLFCILDIFISAIAFICYGRLYYLPIILISAIGYKGTKNLSKFNIRIYLVWLFLNFVFKTILIILFYIKYYDKLVDNNTIVYTIIFTILLKLVNLWIIKLVYNFHSILYDISDSQLIYMKQIIEFNKPKYTILYL